MSTATIRPSTIDGIKQLAKKIRRERKISHTLALGEASRQAGYENFVHAKRQLTSLASGRGFPVYLSIHWLIPHVRNDEPNPTGLRAGREILCLELARPLHEIVAKHRVGYGRGLHGFRMEYEDHLEHRTNVEGQSNARKLLLNAARSLRFMEATGLQPVSTARYNRISQMLDTMPGKDHMSDWFDPISEEYVCLDEPYMAATNSDLSKREHWLERHGLWMIAPVWEGLYYAGECVPYIINQDKALLERISDALAKVEPLQQPEIWPYETGECNDDFVSPKRQADGKKRRRRPDRSWGDRNGATPYGGEPGVPSRWRPAKPMSLELHQRLGALMKGLTIGFSSRVSRKLSSIRSNLDDWLFKEHKELHGDASFDMYYSRANVEYGDTDTKRLQMLVTARSIITLGYEDCKPRRMLLEGIDAAIDEVNRQLAKNVPPAPAFDTTASSSN